MHIDIDRDVKLITRSAARADAGRPSRGAHHTKRTPRFHIETGLVQSLARGATRLQRLNFLT